VLRYSTWGGWEVWPVDVECGWLSEPGGEGGTQAEVVVGRVLCISGRDMMVEEGKCDCWELYM
jgi:hypothetical protein